MLDIKLTEEMYYVCHHLYWEMFAWGSLSVEETQASKSFGPVHDAMKDAQVKTYGSVYGQVMTAYQDHLQRSENPPPNPLEYALPAPDHEKLGVGVRQLKQLMTDPIFLAEVEATDKIRDTYNAYIRSGKIRFSKFCEHCGKPKVISSARGVFCEDKCGLQEAMDEPELQRLQRLIDQASEPA